MRILCDIDGVLCEYNWPKLVKDFFGVDITKYQIFAYDIADVLGVAPFLVNNMFREQVYGDPHFVPQAMSTLRDWEGLGYDIAIYSNRVKYMKEEGLTKWLIKYKIPFTGIDSKGTAHLYDYCIDDSPAKLMASTSKIKLLYDQPWNKSCLNITKQLHRIKNWEEIHKEVNHG